MAITPIVIAQNQGFIGLGDGSQTHAEGSCVHNAIFASGGNLYAVTVDATGHLQAFRSTNSGSTWATFGALTTSSQNGNGFAAVLVSGSIWCFYGTNVNSATLAFVYARQFTLSSGIWGSENTFNVNTGANPFNQPIGPYGAWLRPDGTILLILNEGVSTTPQFFVVFTPSTVSWANPVPLGLNPPSNNSYEASLMRSDGTVDILTVTGNEFISNVHYYNVSPGNVASSQVDILVSTSFNVIGEGIVGPGDVDGSNNLYFPAGITSGANAQIAIAYNNGTWNITGVLDSDAAHDVYSAGLLRTIGTTFWLYYIQVDHATGTKYRLRLGSAPIASFTSPGAWTWQTYDYVTPSPAVSGAVAPYVPVNFNGISSAMSISGTTLLTDTSFTDASSNRFIIYLSLPAPALSISCNSPPNGIVGTPYSHAFPASNGTPPYTFAITAGTIPPGTSLNTSTGVIAGTPTQAGTFSFTIQVTDSVSGTASVPCSITILASITFSSLPMAIMGLAYTASLAPITTGGSPPYTYAVTAGSLPPGISLASNGQFSGIPLQIGTYGFTVRVTDSLSNIGSVPTFIVVTGGYSPGTPTILFEWAPSFIPKREITYARPTDWTDCGYKGRKFIRGFRAHANTFGTPRVVNIQFDGGQTGPYVTMLHNGEETLAYSVTPFDEAQPLVATYIRIIPTSTPGVSPLILPLVSPATSDWCFWDQDTEWEYDPYPDLTTLRTPWQQPSGGGFCWVQGIRLTADTAGLTQNLQILKDGNVLATTITVNHNGQQTLPYTWVPFLAHDLAIQPLGPCAIWSANQLAWVFTPVPENVQYWIARPTSFGMEGFFHIRDGIFAYGGGPGVFTITMDTGETFSVNLPAASGVENKFYFVANPLKGMLATLSAVGSPTLQVYVEDIELRVKQWGSTGPYKVVRIPGDISKVEARI